MSIMCAELSAHAHIGAVLERRLDELLQRAAALILPTVGFIGPPRGCLPAGGWRSTLPCTRRGVAMPIDLSRASAGKQMRDTWQSTSAALVRRYQNAFAKAADLQPVQRLDGVDSHRDRFLNDVGTRADELHGQLLRAMRDRAISG